MQVGLKKQKLCKYFQLQASYGWLIITDATEAFFLFFCFEFKTDTKTDTQSG